MISWVHFPRDQGLGDLFIGCRHSCTRWCVGRGLVAQECWQWLCWPMTALPTATCARASNRVPSTFDHPVNRGWMSVLSRSCSVLACIANVAGVLIQRTSKYSWRVAPAASVARSWMVDCPRDRTMASNWSKANTKPDCWMHSNLTHQVLWQMRNFRCAIDLICLHREVARLD